MHDKNTLLFVNYNCLRPIAILDEGKHSFCSPQELMIVSYTSFQPRSLGTFLSYPKMRILTMAQKKAHSMPLL